MLAFEPTKPTHYDADGGYDPRVSSSLKDRVREVIRDRSERNPAWSAKSWSLSAGLSHGQVSTFLARENRGARVGMNDITLRVLADAAGVNFEWLKSGTGPRDVVPSVARHEEASESASTPAPPQTASCRHEDQYRIELVVDRGRVPELRFDALADWTALLAVARVQRPDIHEELWARVGRTPLFLPERPTPETLVRVAELLRGR